ncbi:hypothetical protein LSH36_361g03027 [Paralvinella palmiformis]|uniref:Uncharacterized protein n=1 Tax=Paralvinella palmiformis TaxID=53620 RepID=A0AAD9JF62_9ANNE|nr:hypothetical protein LSH36_361g03027 [Paralvinella palmiformis]
MFRHYHFHVPRSREGSASSLSRILNRASVRRLRTSVEWFEDHRFTRQHNAKYLKKLESLRTEVIAQEQVNLSQTFNRLKTDGYGGNNHGDVIKSISRTKAPSVRETYPERFKRLQRQRNDALQKRKQPHGTAGIGQQTGSNRISALQGEKLIESVAPEDRDCDCRSSDNGEASDARSGQSVWDSLTARDVITYQKSRLGQVKNNNAATNIINNLGSLQHQSSIPNLGRKSMKQPKPLLPLNDYELRRTDSFIRQMALHQKDARGLYKGANRRHLLRGDTDEIVDLTPEAFRFDVLSEKQFVNGIGPINVKQYTVPVPTPVLWPQTPTDRRRPNKSAQSKPQSAERIEAVRDQPDLDDAETATENPECPGESGEGETREDESLEFRLYKHVDYPLPVRPVHPTLLRTPTSVYAPTNKGYIRVLETVNQRASRRGQALGRSGLDELRISGTNSDSHRSNQQMADFMKDHPDTVSVKTDAGDVILVNRSNTALNWSMDRASTMTYANTPEYTRTTTPTNLPSGHGGDRKISLVVQMPDIILNPPTPSRRLNSAADETVHLRKTFRQNELREKELIKLLDDVKELNDISDRRRRGDVEETSMGRSERP